MASLPVTEQQLIDGATDLDTIEAIANSSALTTVTRLGNTVKTMAGLRASTKYDVPVAYTSGLNVTTETYTVDEGGIIYAVKPSSVPIASTPGTFNSSDWYPIQDPRGYIHKDSKAEMSAIAVAAVAAGDIVETKYRSTAGDGAGGRFRVTKSDISTEVAADTQGGIYIPFDASPGDGSNGGFIREWDGKNVNADWFIDNADSDHTVQINEAIAALGSNGGTVHAHSAYTVSAQANTSPNDFATSDGDSSPDAPEDSAILLRNKVNITLDLSGATITSGNTYAVSMYRSENCHVIGQPNFVYSGTMSTSQPAAISMIRCLYCTGGGIADGHYRLFYGLKNANCKWMYPIALNSEYFAIYMAGLLDVSVNSNSDWISVPWTNKVIGGIARNCEYGSYFCEYTEMWFCDSYDMNNAAVAGNHYSLQTGPYRAYFCNVYESDDQNSGNTIDGFAATGTSTAKTAATDTVIHGCKIKGCYRAIKTAGGADVQITDNEYEDYYATGIAVVTLTDYPVDDIVIRDNKDKGLNSASTVTATGDVKIASIQLEKNVADITNPLIDGNVVNLDRGGTTTPAGTAYEIYCEGITGLKAPPTNQILGTQGTFNFVDTDNGVVTMDADDTTPSVNSRNAANITFLTSQANTGATAITQFDDAVAGQTVVFRVGSATNAPTIADSGNFVLSAAFGLTLNDTITLYTSNGTTWYEVSRSDN